MKYSLPALFLISVLLPTSVPQDGLAADGRVATITSTQGTTLARPVGRERWTLLRPTSLLVPGDQIRTSSRGANAAELGLAGGGKLIVGPGSLIEIPKKGQIKLYRGDFEIVGSKKSELQVNGPGGYSETITGKKTLRVTKEKVLQLNTPPQWLTGYRSSTTDEWMGSLLAKVDGRDVPLSVGYHKVDAVIRDQIAQTTIEQSFVNSTQETLEGVFYFPLPADASISGFGMWINGELVEADIVERQRARQIYEDILRRKKDPGLLEWSGGNLFKARVYPILPRAEKRIRIRYTQVLPLEGSTVRYRYALQSDLLRQHPLRQLQIKVSVFSTLELASVTSTNHTCRARKTAHAATLEYDAEEYSPTSDFEASIKLKTLSNLTVVPHRRGNDGYFMLLLHPPGQNQAGWQRELMPERDKLDLVLVADTSGSMNAAARKTQADFLAGVLAMLGAEDQFRLMTCDVSARWFRDLPAAATEENAEAALAWLDRRPSLGWTNLDRAFASVGKTLQPNTLVIYVGDGIGTTGDCDPVKLAQRIARLETSGSTFHAVSTSNTYEKIVLEAIAHKGGGSVRRAGKKPAETAFRLLSEAAQPSVKNLTVTFEGLRTARVYPETLPHLPVGHQQTVLGRFLPGEGTQSGQVVVTGNLGGKPIRYATEVSIQEDEEGNSFLPRLWARQHLDALLTRGRSAAAKQEVVSLSQEYDIITPFTSFLVLKNDEERKRYGIARRVKMRDGEAIFAQARDRAAVEVLRQQMKEAHAWRMRLRARMLEEIGALGRDHIDGSIAYATTTEKLGFPKLSHASSSPFESSMLNSAIGLGGGSGGRFGARYGGAPGPRGAPISGSNTFFVRDAGEPELMEFEVVEEMSEDRAGTERSRQIDKSTSGPSTPGPAGPSSLLGQSKRLREEYGQGGQASDLPFSVLAYKVPPAHSTGLSHFGLPHLAVKPPEEETGFETPTWAEDILSLLRRIDRRPSLRSLQAGLRLNSTGGTVHSLHGQLLSQHTSSTVYTPGRWYKWNHGRGAQPSESWLTATQRGTLAAALRLGRVRQAQEGDQRSFGFALPDFSMTDLVRAYRHHRASIKSHSDSTVVISLRPSASSPWETRLHIDTNKNVILGLEEFSSGRPTGSTRFTGHTEIAGSWWPKLTETLDRQGRVIWRQEMAVTATSSDEVDLAIAKAMSEHGDVIFVNAKVPRLAASKQAVHAGKADLLDHLRIADHYRNSQQWDRVWQAWEAAEALSNNKPGALWIRARILTDSRRGEEAKRWFQELANITSSTKDANRAVFLASHLRGLAGAIVNNNEENTLSENLKPTYFAQGKDRAWRERQWQHWQANLLGRQNRHEDAERIYAAILREHPRDVGALLGELRALTVIGKSDAALALAAERLEPDQRWLPEEAGRIYEFWTDLLWQQRKQADLRRVLDQWVARADETKTAYGRWLSLFLYEDKEELANAWVRDRFAEKAQPSDPIQMAQLNAATQLALGKGWGFHAQRVIDLWHQPLATLAATSARSDDPILLGLANQILSNTGYRKTSAFAATKRKLLGELMADKAIEEMHGPRLAAYLGWLSWGKSQVEESTWTKIVSRLHARWKATEDPDLRQQLGGELLKLFDAYEAKKQALVFLRAWKNSTTARYRPQVTRILLERLIKEGWTAEIETELFTLIPDLLTQNMSDQQRRHTVAGSIRWLAKNLESMRKKELLGPVEKLETLPRTQRDTKTASAEKAARKALASTFHTQAKASDDLAARWMQIESLGFATQAGENPKKIAGAVRELLLEIPDSKDHDTHRVLRERCCVTLAHASAQGGTGASVISEALATYQDGYEQNPGSLNWRYQIFRLLVALDRPGEIEARLREWIKPEKAERQWRIALGYLLAELGKIAEAAATFEFVEQQDELRPSEYEALANWYLVLNDDKRRGQALDKRWRTTPNNSTSWRLHSESRKLTNRGTGAPANLDPELLRMLRALLGTASHPANHIHRVDSLYRSTKDFRLLESLADGVIGHTPQGVYPFLSRVGELLSQVADEATCDQIERRIKALAATAKTDTDRRGLQLLGALVARRAGQVVNQPGGHLVRALEGMTEAFKEDWGPGERKLAASFLASLGHAKPQRFADEQLRQLKELLRQEKDPRDRLSIGRDLARTHWAWKQHDKAIDTLGVSIAEFKLARQGQLPADANNAIELLANYLSESGAFGRAEKLLVDGHKMQTLPAQKLWYFQHLCAVHAACLEKRGTTSLGTGSALLTAAQKLIEKAMREEMMFFSNHLGSYLSLHRSAHKGGLAQAKRDLEEFGKNVLPNLLAQLPPDGRNRGLARTASMLSSVHSRKAALRLLVQGLETEPDWFRRIGENGWMDFAWDISRYRSKGGTLGDLEPRLLAVVIEELGHHLHTQGWRRLIYDKRNSVAGFWAEKSKDFLAVARRVIEESTDSPSRTAFCADYLWSGLDERKEAVDTLVNLDRRSPLGHTNRSKLAGWLLTLNRHSEAFPHLETLLAKQPDVTSHRTRMMVALHGLDRDADARRLLGETRSLFEKQKRWQGGVIAAVAKACFDCEFWQDAAGLYDEAIKERQRAQPLSRNGDYRLSGYYTFLGRAHGKLGRHDEAIDASAAAVVAWGSNERSRRKAIAALHIVLAGIENLDAYTKRRDRKIAKTGLDAPLLRRLMGQIFLERGDTEAAVKQLLLARDLQPNDMETHSLLVKSFDQNKDAAGAARCLLEAIELSPRELDLYAELAKRYASSKETEAEAERAWTSMVEAKPNEADSHRRLAEHREEKKDFAAACLHWKNVTRIRGDEPDGWMRLAKAQLSKGSADAARLTIERLLKTTWDGRFGDIHGQAAVLLKTLHDGSPR